VPPSNGGASVLGSGAALVLVPAAPVVGAEDALLAEDASPVLADGEVAGLPLPQAARSAAASRKAGQTAARRVTR
jgi:hypothetical protein